MNRDDSVSAKERFFKKVQQNNDITPPGKSSAEAEIRLFCGRMDELAEQISEWFAGSSIEVVVSTKHIHDLSTIGYSLNCGICRYPVTTIRIQNADRSASIVPEQLCRGAERGCVTMRIETPESRQAYHLSMAPETGWFIRREHQDAKANVLMTEDRFFQALDKLA